MNEKVNFEKRSKVKSALLKLGVVGVGLLGVSGFVNALPSIFWRNSDGSMVDLASGGGGSSDLGVAVQIDGIGIPPLVGAVGGDIMPFSGTFTGWKVIEVNGVSSSIVLTIKKNGTAISGTEKPTLSSATSAEDLSLSTWTTSFSKGDVISATIDSVATGTKFAIKLYAEASN